MAKIQRGVVIAVSATLTAGLLTVAATLIAGVFSLAVVPEADAIPAFSRKYSTSCATCHVAYPKLNAFGEAFRNNGYRMPGGDEQYEEDEPVRLGAEPWKRLWPEAIWPGDLPYLPPVSLFFDNEYIMEPGAEVSNDFQFPSNVALLTGGTFGDSVSFFGRINFVAPGEDLHVHRLFGQLDGLFGTRMLNVRFGQLEPRSVPFSSNRRLTRANYLVNTSTFPLSELLEVLSDEGHGDEEEEADAGGHQHGGDFSLATTQKGVEVWGVADGFGGRGGLEYGFGVVNGNGSGDFAENGTNDNNSDKDLFWRASYKVGGMSVLGDAATAPAQTDNWRDDSLRLGTFGYRGSAPFELPHGHGEEAEEDHGPTFLERLTQEIREMGFSPHDVGEDFTRVGIDADLRFRDLNLFGAYMWGETRLDPLALDSVKADFNSWFVEGDYVIYPWLVGALRYEKIDLPEMFHENDDRWVPHVTALIRANAKVTFDALLYPENSRNNRYLLNVAFAF